MPDRDPGSRMMQTDLGWGLISDSPTDRRDLYWIHAPTRDIYTWDGDGWYRVKPSDGKHWKE